MFQPTADISMSVSCLKVFFSLERILFIEGCFVINEIEWFPAFRRLNSTRIVKRNPPSQIICTSNIKFVVPPAFQNIDVMHGYLITQGELISDGILRADRRICPPRS